MRSSMIHGGAWQIPDDRVADHLAGVAAALARGRALLEKGAAGRRAPPAGGQAIMLGLLALRGVECPGAGAAPAGADAGMQAGGVAGGTNSRPAG